MSLENLYALKYPDLFAYKVIKLDTPTSLIYKGFQQLVPEHKKDDEGEYEDLEFSVTSELEGLHRDMIANLRHAKEAEERGETYVLERKKNKLFLLSKEYVKEHGSLPAPNSNEWLDLVNQALVAKKKKETEPKFEFDEDINQVRLRVLEYAKYGHYARRVYKRTLLKQFELDKQKKVIEDLYESFGEYSKKQGNYIDFSDMDSKQINRWFETEVDEFRKKSVKE